MVLAHSSFQNACPSPGAPHLRQHSIHPYLPLHSLLGTVINLMQFQSQMDVTMRIAVSSNNTQCVNLDVQDTHMQVKEMNIQLIETYVNPFFSLLP